MKKKISIFMALTMLLTSLTAAISAQAADLSAPTFTKESGEYNTEYGFVYSYEETDDLTVENGIKRVAANHLENGNKTSFNLVFTGIPKENYSTKISARAYVCIDGVYFYSDILTRSFEGVANAVLNDSTVDESIKVQLKGILEA